MIKSLLQTAAETLHSFMEKDANLDAIARAAEALAEIFRNGNKVIIFGNGGSMCDAMHFAEELSGRFRNDRPALPAIALSDPGYLTCVANDYGFDEVFARGVRAFAKPGDMVIGISTSGNSANVIKALQTAQTLGCKTMALLGKDGGKLKDKSDLELIIPALTTDRIQEMHIKILHIMVEMVESKLFPINS